MYIIYLSLRAYVTYLELSFLFLHHSLPSGLLNIFNRPFSENDANVVILFHIASTIYLLFYFFYKKRPLFSFFYFSARFSILTCFLQITKVEYSGSILTATFHLLFNYSSVLLDQKTHLTPRHGRHLNPPVDPKLLLSSISVPTFRFSHPNNPPTLYHNCGSVINTVCFFLAEPSSA